MPGLGFTSPTPPNGWFRHPYEFVVLPTGTMCVCECGWKSDVMLTRVAAQFEADRHAATGSQTWETE